MTCLVVTQMQCPIIQILEFKLNSTMSSLRFDYNVCRYLVFAIAVAVQLERAFQQIYYKQAVSCGLFQYASIIGILQAKILATNAICV